MVALPFLRPSLGNHIPQGQRSALGLPRLHGREFWWWKDIDGLKEAYAELQRPKVGRKARIAGEIGEIVDLPSLFGPKPKD